MKSRKTSEVAPRLTQEQRQLVRDNIALARNMSIKYASLGRTKGIPCQDLQQEACMGLCIAAMRFEPTKGGSFRTYAYDWCRKYVLDLISNEDYVDEDTDGIDDCIADENETAPYDLSIVASLLDTLEHKERTVVCYIYGITDKGHQPAPPIDFREVSDIMHLGIRTVHKIYARAMVKMEENLKTHFREN